MNAVGSTSGDDRPQGEKSSRSTRAAARPAGTTKAGTGAGTKTAGTQTAGTHAGTGANETRNEGPRRRSGGSTGRAAARSAGTA
ncbi:ArsA family ATPase, partial [Frankia sp. AiPs1]|nr:ArsA family ATPase [Frankia sp. AiPs1]